MVGMMLEGSLITEILSTCRTIANKATLMLYTENVFAFTTTRIDHDSYHSTCAQESLGHYFLGRRELERIPHA